MLKWITSYFQNKTDARKNLMIPIRKPNVRINLKKINFKRGPIEESLNKQTRQPKPDITSTFVDVSSKPEEIKKPETFSNARRLNTDELKEKVYQKKSPGLTTVLFLFAILFCISSLIFVTVTAQSSQREEKIKLCKELFTTSIEQGLDLEGVNCKTKEDLLSKYNKNEAESVLGELQNKVNTQANSAESRQKNLDDKINLTRGYLESFGLEANKIPPYSEKKLSLNDDLTAKQQYLTKLEKLLEEETGTLQNTLSYYKFLLDTNPELDLTTEKSYYSSFVGLEQQKQYSSYKEFVLKYNELIQKISKSSDNEFIATGLADKEVFNYKYLTGEEFKQVWIKSKKLNTNSAKEIPITGDAGADNKIVQIAQKRGYQQQPEADSTKLVPLENELVQPEFEKAFKELKAAAAKDGVDIGVVSGFRSTTTQKDLFLSRFNAAAISKNGVVFDNGQIAGGVADEIINSVLIESSVPGYSKHHTGYTMDFKDNSSSADFTLFKNTKAYRWLKANNFYNAKRFGIIPSYPEGVDNQGPDPEPWEYVYVGKDQLIK
jgi:LAS superfamily LD-carboxypeptidase LdcB